jgi:hypothetical protein
MGKRRNKYLRQSSSKHITSGLELWYLSMEIKEALADDCFPADEHTS